jgi:hypothetical protein
VVETAQTPPKGRPAAHGTHSSVRFVSLSKPPAGRLDIWLSAKKSIVVEGSIPVGKVELLVPVKELQIVLVRTQTHPEGHVRHTSLVVAFPPSQ